MWGSHRHCRWHYRLREEWQRTWLPPTWNHRAYQESWHQAQWWEVCYQDKGVQFLRHALHTRWGQAKPSQVQAIKNLEPPKDKKELHTFLRMATYIMSSFIPKLADHIAPLTDLLKENVDFAWNPLHSKAFEKVKSLISNLTTLAYYNRNETFVLHVDASIKGLRAALFQNNRPIALASKALTPAETRYANIKRELLAVVLWLWKIPFLSLWNIVCGSIRSLFPCYARLARQC